MASSLGATLGAAAAGGERHVAPAADAITLDELTTELAAVQFPVERRSG